jgi:hypothetical protein
METSQAIEIIQNPALQPVQGRLYISYAVSPAVLFSAFSDNDLFTCIGDATERTASVQSTSALDHSQVEWLQE